MTSSQRQNRQLLRVVVIIVVIIVIITTIIVINIIIIIIIIIRGISSYMIPGLAIFSTRFSPQKVAFKSFPDKGLGFRGLGF